VAGIRHEPSGHQARKELARRSLHFKVVGCLSPSSPLSPHRQKHARALIRRLEIALPLSARYVTWKRSSLQRLEDCARQSSPLARPRTQGIRKLDMGPALSVYLLTREPPTLVAHRRGFVEGEGCSEFRESPSNVTREPQRNLSGSLGCMSSRRPGHRCLIVPHRSGKVWPVSCQKVKDVP